MMIQIFALLLGCYATWSIVEILGCAQRIERDIFELGKALKPAPIEPVAVQTVVANAIRVHGSSVRVSGPHCRIFTVTVPTFVSDESIHCAELACKQFSDEFVIAIQRGAQP